MNLLFSRSQMRASFLSLIPLRVGGTVTFKLRAELELTPDELALARKYSFTKATLIRSDPAEDMANAYRPALLLSIMIVIGIVILVPTVTFGRWPEAILFKALTALASGFAGFVVLTLLYFFKLQKYVSVDQLLNGGRMFYCHSVVELDEREAELLDICQRFYLTLEKAKNWGGREINPLPDGEPFYLSNPEGDEHRVAIDRAVGAVVGTTSSFTVERSAEPVIDEIEETESGVWSNLKSMLNRPNDWRAAEKDAALRARPTQAPHTPPNPSDHPTPPASPPTPPVAQPAEHPVQRPPESSPPRQVTPPPTHPFAPKPPDDRNPGF